jgi:hypothetical protein
MKIQLPPTLQDQSGTIDQITFSHNKYGLYSKKRSNPGIHKTDAAVKSKNFFKQCSQTWATLPTANLIAWNNFSQYVTKHNYNGMPYNPTPRNCFMHCNINYQYLTGALLLMPPPFRLFSLIFSCVFNYSPQQQAFFFTPYIPVIDPQTYFLVYMTPPIKPTINYVKTFYRFMFSWETDIPNPAINLSDYNAHFPGALTSGYRIFAKVVTIDQTSGLESIPVFCNIILP